jgi:predicted transcriptional regulator
MLVYVKVTIDLDADLYRALKIEAARLDRSVRDVVADAITGWLDRREEDEDRASAAEALAEYERDGGTAAAEFFERLAAEARAEYGSGR